ncbi:hypothetical protein KXW88_006959 [Aspergillus fumigatus]|nr:hypothetical protein KXW88_006959 [Aspergillus fumigatus]KAH2307511.1 hypothetical protein KXV47_007044 [Aspergillus fumigatus]KAH2925977.1 hypothetical protein KXW15_002737 [Aspergillus fumigatus]
MDFPPPPGLDLSESRRANLYAAYSSTYGLAVVAVVLRLWCRTRVSKAMATGNYVDMVIWVYRGVGTHIYPLGMTGFSNFFVNLFVYEIFYTLSICVTKYSILMFYWRIFGTTNIRIPIYVIFFLVTCWGLGVIFTTIFQCLPVRGFWDKSVNPHCGVDVNQFFIGNAVPNIITDWALLILPMPYIWRLHRDIAQKIAISSVFVLGGFICVISIVRLVIMLDSYRVPSIDVTCVFIGPSTWTAVETNIGVVSACLPSLRPLLHLFDRDYGTQDRATPPKHSAHSYGTLSSTGKRSKRSKMRNDSELHLSTIDVTTTVDIEESCRY